MTANLTFLWPEAALHPAGKVEKLVGDDRLELPTSSV
jgi:hypothetical protein